MVLEEALTLLIVKEPVNKSMLPSIEQFLHLSVKPVGLEDGVSIRNNNKERGRRTFQGH